MKEFNLQDLDGVGPTTEKKLNNAGIFTPFDIVVRGTKEFSRVSGLDIDVAEKHVNSIRKILSEEGEVIEINDLETLRKLREKQIKTPLNVPELDEMLKGGIETQSLYEIYGGEGNGKTQMSTTLAVEALENDRGVSFIDCEGTFDEERFDEIYFARYGKKYTGNKLAYHLWADPVQLITGVRGMIEELIKKDVRYIIIDGLVGVMRLNYEGRGELYDRQNELEVVLKYLKNISMIFNIGVIITNQVMANPEPFGPKEKPVGGHVLGHYVKYIIHITRGLKNNRVAHLVKSNKGAQGDYTFFLNEEGVSQYESMSAKKKAKKMDDVAREDTQGLIKKDLLLEDEPNEITISNYAENEIKKTKLKVF